MDLKYLQENEMVADLMKQLDSDPQSYQALKRIALFDPLTGIYNRQYFGDLLEREFSLSKRYAIPVGCILADIDNFSSLNDRYGHATGDWVLQQTAAFLSNTIRQGDLIARFGGEEFVILLPMTNLEASADVATRLCTAISKMVWKSPAGELGIGISCGVAGMPAVYVDQPRQLVDCAEKALCEAKGKGRNRVEVYREEEVQS
jgi:diguanylate cyclase (GGDEF)-like protein